MVPDADIKCLAEPKTNHSCRNHLAIDWARRKPGARPGRLNCMNERQFVHDQTEHVVHSIFVYYFGLFKSQPHARDLNLGLTFLWACQSLTSTQLVITSETVFKCDATVVLILVIQKRIATIRYTLWCFAARKVFTPAYTILMRSSSCFSTHECGRQFTSIRSRLSVLLVKSDLSIPQAAPCSNALICTRWLWDIDHW